MEIKPEVIEDLNWNSVSPDGMNVELFAAVPWSIYLQIMSRVPTYVDEITLRVISSVYGFELSLLGQHVMVDIASDTFSRGLITINHFDEKNGIHYVVLNTENPNTDDGPQSEPET